MSAVLVFVISQPKVQSWLIQRSTTILSTELHTKVVIGRVDANLFQKLILEKVVIFDQQNDTLLYAGKIYLNIADVLLMKKNIALHQLRIDDAVVKVYRTPNNNFNYQFLVDLLNQPATGNSNNWLVKLTHIQLNNCLLNYNDFKSENVLAKINQIKIDFDAGFLNEKQISISNIYINQPYIGYHKIYYKNAPTQLSDTSIKRIKFKSAIAFAVSKLIIENGELVYKGVDTTNNAISNRMNFSNLHFLDINTTLSNIKIDSNAIAGMLNNFEIKEKCGFEIKRANAQLVFNNRILKLSNCSINTSKSKINQTIDLKFDDENLMAFEKIRFDAQLQNSVIDPYDVNFFVDVPKWINTISIDGGLSGKLGKLKSDDVEIVMGDNYFKGKCNLVGLPDLKNTYIDFKTEQLKTTGNNLLMMLPETQHPELLARMGTMFFKGSLTGFMSDFVAFGALKTDLGTIDADVNMKIGDAEKLYYKGSISSTQFNLDDLTNHQYKLGNVSLAVEVQGKNWLNNNPEVNVNGLISELGYNHYQYSNITLNGVLKQKQFNGKIISNDPNIDFVFNGGVNLFDTLPKFNFTSIINSVDFYKLHFTTQPFCIAHANMIINALGNTIDNFSGDAVINNLIFQTNETEFQYKKIHIESFNKNLSKELTLKADNITLNIDGDFNYENLPFAFAKYLNKYFPSYIQASSTEKNITAQNFKFNFKFNDNQNLFSLIKPNWKLIGNADLKGTFSSNDLYSEVAGNLPAISIGDAMIEPIQIHTYNSKNKLFATIQSKKIFINDSFSLYQPTIQLSAINDSLLFKYSMAADKKKASIQLEALSLLKNNLVSTRILQSEFFIKGYEWIMLPTNKIDFRDNYFYFNDVVLNHLNEQITINSFADENNRPANLKLSLKNIQLLELSDVLNAPPEAIFSGVLNAEVDLFNYNDSSITAQAKINVNQCITGKDTIGDIDGYLLYSTASNKVFSNLKVMQGENEAKIIGNFNLLSKQNALDYTVHLTKFNLKTVEPLIHDVLTDKHGVITGNATITGSIKHPIINADVSAENGGVTINYINTHYTFKKLHATCKNNIIQFDNTPLLDVYNNEGVFYGSIDIDNFKAVNLNLHVKTNRLFVYNTTMQQNNLFFGKAYASGQIDITGITYQVVINAKARALKGTKVYIPITDERDLSQHDFIQFVSSKADSATHKKDYVVDLDGITLKFDVDILPEAELNILMDLVAGDYIRGYGNGNVKVEYSTNTAFSILGGITLERGEYYFTFLNIPKNFFINSGSSINWNGDPYNGNLDVIGTYQTRVAFYPLVADLIVDASEVTTAKNKLPMQLKMDLKGSLKHPDISFDINPLSTVVSSVDFKYIQRLQAVKADQNELSNQVFALLSMNSFIAPQNISGFTNPLANTSTYKQSGTDLISNQVSRVLNDAFYRITKSNNTQINFNYRLYDQSIDARNYSQVDFNVSQRLLKDRLLLDVRGIYDNGVVNNLNNNGLAGDFAIEYNLTPDGRIRLRGFRKTEYDILNERNRNRTGIALSYRKEFNKISEFWINERKRRSIKN